ncbi:heparinase II/III family protein [Arthrobacter sp. ATA002]|uniref:heparinase II/III domain-containing protein n=1 Tax=Arthrobacter sp. ATA002 TaxID=2991715 RepID=UPI0022A6B155|nr:heparinase II/III family protein [Arthrobacter sp. ATA002]WAP53328.1 heparinase II/III family protein [Arthrobacter sp. ATA002]
MFSAAYNADYHKHSDDLSLFLRSKGIDLLSESGPYGYDYKHPFSRYAYSQYSHNSLVVDGVSLPRTDGLRHKVQLVREAETETDFTVVGTNGRYPDTIHNRRLQVQENGGMPSFFLTDTIISSQPHTYQLLWNLGPDVRAHLTTNGFDLMHGAIKVLELRLEGDVPVRISLHEGEQKPRPLGWRFPRFGHAVPTQVVMIKFEGAAAELETTIRLSDFERVPAEQVSSPASASLRSMTTPAAYNITAGPLGTSIHIAAELPSSTEVAYRLYRGSEPVSMSRYSRSHEALFDDLAPGRYRIRVFTRQNAVDTPTAFTTKWVQI